VHRAQLEPVQTNRVEVFQFLIGNTDFSLLRGPAKEACCHNSVPLLAPDGSYSLVPYDFDATGVVDPPYALPVKALRIKNVRQRIYRGKCEPMDIFERTLAEFRDSRLRISAALVDQQRLSASTAKTLHSYVDDFYAIIDDPKRVEKDILRICAK
jgi:hypothetical protein